MADGSGADARPDTTAPARHLLANSDDVIVERLDDWLADTLHVH